MTTQSILGNTRRSDISFSPNGKIDISSRIVKALGMEKGDVIDMMVESITFMYQSMPPLCSVAMRLNAIPHNEVVGIFGRIAGDYA